MQVIRGKDTVERLSKEYTSWMESAKEPCLVIMRVGEREDDIAYEKGAVKRMEKYGIIVRSVVLENSVSQEEFLAVLEEQNQNKSVHGILILRPLPAQIKMSKVVDTIDPKKDVEGLSASNVSGIFYGFSDIYTPCTAQAVMEMIETEKIDLAGKNVVVLGRSTVVGKPLALMMMEKQATVTVCNSKTKNIQHIAKQADILVSAIGRARMITADYVSEHSIVIDVGTNMDENNVFCGDVDFDAVAPIVKAITPVPGGVGGVTTCILAGNVLRASQS